MFAKRFELNSMQTVKQFLWVGAVFLSLVSFEAKPEPPRSMLVYTRFRGGLDPAMVFNPFEESLLRCTFQSLVRQDSNGRIVGDLAKAWRLSKDQRSVVFDLAEDAKFSNGKAVTSDDVVRSFKRLLEPSAKFLQKELLQSLVGSSTTWVAALGPHQVRLTLLHAYGPLLLLMSSFEYSVLPPGVGFHNGSAGYTIEVLAENEKFQVRSKSPKDSPWSRVRVTYDLSEVELALKAGQEDLIVDVPIFQATHLKISPEYSLLPANRYSPLIFELNHDRPIFADADFRRDLKRVIWSMTHIPTDAKGLIEPVHHFVPRGLLPPEYYRKKRPDQMQWSKFEKKWRSRIKKYGLSFWLPEKFYPEVFVERLRKTFGALPNAKVYSAAYPEVVGLFDKGQIDVTNIDPSSYFADPDSFLILWKANRPKFPFSGKELMTRTSRVRFWPNPQERLEMYTKAVLNFEAQNWVIPLYQTRYPIFKKNGVDLPDVNLTTFNLLCP